MERAAASTHFPVGSDLPSFMLPDVGGDVITDAYLRKAPASLVVFSCNHCPYVIGSEKMLFDTIRVFQAKGLRAVLINANDPTQYPEDSFENMKRKAQQLPCPYLFDESQLVAKRFDAQCTPECFLFDAHQVLVFHGTISNFLQKALEQVFAGQKPEPDFVHPIGCSIKWKQ